MHFRFFAALATVILTGIVTVAASPSPNALDTRGVPDSVGLDVSRRQLSSILGIVENVTSILGPILSGLGTCKSYS